MRLMVPVLLERIALRRTINHYHGQVKVAHGGIIGPQTIATHTPMYQTPELLESTSSRFHTWTLRQTVCRRVVLL